MFRAMRLPIALCLLAAVAAATGSLGASPPGPSPGPQADAGARDATSDGAAADAAARDARADGVKADAGPVPACVEVSSYVVNSGFGFDHVVRLASSCDADARCQVSTDVNPEIIQVELPAHETREVVTFRGAPGYAFQAHVQCRLVSR